MDVSFLYYLFGTVKNLIMKVKEIIKLIETDGWFLKRQKGSHMVFVHPVKKDIVVVPNHGMDDDVKKGTAKSIFKQAGIE